MPDPKTVTDTESKDEPCEWVLKRREDDLYAKRTSDVWMWLVDKGMATRFTDPDEAFAARRELGSMETIAVIRVPLPEHEGAEEPQSERETEPGKPEAGEPET